MAAVSRNGEGVVGVGNEKELPKRDARGCQEQEYAEDPEFTHAIDDHGYKRRKIAVFGAHLTCPVSGP
jgi:hypothetical protein